MNVKLNIQAIRIAENLLKKPFGSIDMGDDEAATALMYGMVYANNDEPFTLEIFKKLLEQKKTARDIYRSVRNEMECIRQFGSETESTGEPPYISEIADLLIMWGMDAHYVNYEMKIFEIEGYMKAFDTKKRDEMESDRLWTYLTILPHVNTKKIKKPQDLMMFPWEVDERKKRGEQTIDKSQEMIDKFLKSIK